MAGLSIVTLPPDLLDLKHTVLRQKASPIDLSDPKQLELCRKLTLEMFEALYETGGSGLAAPQVGIPLRMFIAHPLPLGIGPQVFLNPEIVDPSLDQVLDEEGCLSIPGYRGKVLRAAKLTLRAYNLAGQLEVFEVADFMARVVQHEVDHLDGILYTDYLNPEEDLALGGSSHRRRAERALEHIEASQLL